MVMTKTRQSRLMDEKDAGGVRIAVPPTGCQGRLREPSIPGVAVFVAPVLGGCLYSEPLAAPAGSGGTTSHGAINIAFAFTDCLESGSFVERQVTMQTHTIIDWEDSAIVD